ncbi:YeaC family protein [Agitococcus lubricus]|uniref:DUF1315 family protein n=1 Tax=Agitococcus lubricus TaxID=1077255 RepID=A0A2T5IZI3_9GAMM|nr:DUF1315 family protein [Agitococcus lubricus]PTQ89491.1 hypothetical protein C8N29_10622 [Agitococcus lubricus]
MNHDTFAAVLAALTPDIVANLKRAVELGKWPDGRRVTDEQRETCMQAVLVWEMQHLPEQERTGYIHKGEKEGETCDDHDHNQEQTIKFLH